jgi:hypothetical protein
MGKVEDARQPGPSAMRVCRDRRQPVLGGEKMRILKESKVFWGLLLAATLLIMPSYGQNFRGTITGTVVDPSGAAVPGAQVEARDLETLFITSAETNGDGIFSIPFLVPGNYRVSVTAKGFKQSVRDNLELHAGDKLQVDLKVEIGATTEAVTVSAGGELLQTGTASIGQTINSQQAEDLPGLGRHPFLLATLATGTNSGLYNGKVSQLGRPFDGAAAQMSMQGLGSQYEVLLNGIPDAPTERASAAIYTGFVPSPDAVEEVTVQTNVYDAQYGHSTGAVINTVMLSGANKLHATMYEYFRNDKMNANTYDSNAAGAPTTIMRWNQPGFVLDGPVFIPKVYNGKDKTFFMVSWEKIWNINPTPYLGSVPTALQRAGNFSQTVQTNGQPIVIYDPSTTNLSTDLRTPFPNNIIPAGDINPVGAALMSYYPMPNVAGNIAGFNNFIATPNSQEDHYHSTSVRMDHQINDKQKINGTYFGNDRTQYFPTSGFPAVASPGYTHFRNNQGFSFDWTDTLSPSTVLDIRYGFIFHPFQLKYFGDGFDITQLGFPASLAAQLPHETFPGVSMSNGYAGFQNAVNSGTANSASQFSTTADHSLAGTLSKNVGRHTFKFGAEFFSQRADNDVPISNFGSFSFTAGFTQQNALNGSTSAGSPLASLLLGYPASGAVSYNISSAFQSLYYGGFFQDDWRVTSRLTLNLGLRWDYEGPMSERYNRQNDGFAFTTPNPVQQGVTGLTLDGGLLFDSNTNRLPFVRDLNNWQPRVGLAYQLFNKTVLRGGFGIEYPPTFNTGQSNGFSTNTNYVASNNGNLTPANSLTNPYPSGIIQPTGSSLGLSTLLGQAFTFSDPNRVLPRIYQYSLGIQHEFPWRFALEVAYVGNKAVELPVSQSVNALPGSDFALGSSALNALVPNPMAGLIPSNSALNGATITRQSLLVPYPEFGGLTQAYEPIGKSLYNSLQVTGQKRLSGGLTLRASFTWDKIMQQTSFLNAQDSNLYRDQTNEPNKVFVLSGSYALPFFANRKGFVGGAFGGWSVNIILRATAGYLVSAPGGAISSGVDPQLSGSSQTYTQWFNTCSLNTSGVRQNCASSSQPVAFLQLPAFTLGTLGGYLPGVRTYIPPILDFSIFKTFPIRESLKLQFRAEAFNLANTPFFGAPNTSFGSANFGVTSLVQANDPRIIQLALKLIF